MASADDFFGGGNKSASFKEKNKKVGGRIVAVQDQRQQRDLDGNPKWWDPDTKREPMMQLPIDVQTDERDPEDPTDDGVRTIYVKGDLKRAIAEAVRAAGQRGAPRVGGELVVAWTGDEPASKRGYNDKKIYSAKYTPPSANDEFFGSSNGSKKQPAAVGSGATAESDEPPF